MILRVPKRRTLSTLIFVALFGLSICRFALALSAGPHSPERTLPWQSPARMQRLLTRETGMLVFSLNGVEFRPRSGPSRRWSFTEIKTFDLMPRGFVLTSYQNRGWRLPGDRQFRFRLVRHIPPEVATRLAQLVGKPVINRVPGSHQEIFASIRARHRTLTGGTNGVLRFTQTGISYTTLHNQGARKWRWADIETLANPDPYHFRVDGYREMFDFELKEPMSRTLFDRLWHYVYARHLQVARDHKGVNGDETESAE